MEAGIANRLGMSELSLALSRRIHQQYKKATEPELRPLVLRVLGQ
jgi:hypothetical protein